MRRGYPSIVVHDNAKTFKATGMKLGFATHSTESKPILPMSPWWGGFYERPVHSVKLPLLTVAGKALLLFDELNNFMCENEMFINSRPLVYNSEDDVHESSTPFHLMYGRDIYKCEKVEPIDDKISCFDYSNHYKCLVNILSKYWNRSIKTYLQELRQHHIYRKEKAKSDINLCKGDVVLIMDDNKLQPRNSWKKGIIDEVIYGKDNQACGVKLISSSKLDYTHHVTDRYRR